MRFVTLLLALGLCGCATPVMVSPGWGIMNNTGYILMVYQDGVLTAKMPPGTALSLQRKLFSANEVALVSVAAYNSDGDYKGADSFKFYKFSPYNWQLDHVHRQEFTQ